MTSHQPEPPALADQDAAALLMLFQSQSQPSHRLPPIRPPASPPQVANRERNERAMMAAAALAEAAATPLNPPQEHKSPVVAPRRESEKLTREGLEIDHGILGNLDKSQFWKDKEQKIKAKPKDGIETELEESEPEHLPWKVDPDEGLISCVCKFDHDDGFTVQCDKCFRWQHLICYGMDPDKDIEGDFYCVMCDKSLKIDPEVARKRQQDHLKPTDSDKEKPNRVSRARKRKEETVEEKVQLETLELKDSHLALFQEISKCKYKSQDVFDHFQGLQLDDLPVQQSKVVVKPYEASKKFSSVMKFGLFNDDQTIERGTIFMELLGVLDWQNSYKGTPWNQYTLWGAAKPHVNFIPNSPLVIDSRGQGNLARFIRKSCSANAEIKLAKGKIVVCATEPIDYNCEILLPWEWDVNHPIMDIGRGVLFDELNSKKQHFLVRSLEAIATLTDCGCSTSDCLVASARRSSFHVLRSSRKGQSVYEDDRLVSLPDFLKQRDLDILRSFEKPKTQAKKVIPYKRRLAFQKQPPKQISPKAAQQPPEENNLSTPFKLCHSEPQPREVKKPEPTIRKLSWADYKAKLKK